ncbi:hypothetical protein V6N13_006099 [Hibiscus sabdariffa]
MERILPPMCWLIFVALWILIQFGQKKSHGRLSFSPSKIADRQRTGGPSTFAGPGSAAEGPSTEPYTPMPPVFSHASSLQFQSPMAPPTKGFFVGAFQPYSSMMTAPLHSPGHFFPSPHQWHHYQCIHRKVLAMGWCNIHP